jgi:DNA-binding NarL/FixJ family response regulator
MHDPHVDAPPLRVVIAEDSALIREGIARLIEESGGTVVAKVGDGDRSPPRARGAGLPGLLTRG